MTAMPALETRRLIVRPFELSDLDAVYQLFDVDLFPNNSGKNKIETMQERLEWLQWSVLNYQQLAKLRQPPAQAAVYREILGIHRRRVNRFIVADRYIGVSGRINRAIKRARQMLLMK